MKPIDPRLVRSARSTLPFLVTSVGLGTVTAVLTVGQAWVIATAISRVIDRRGTSGLAPLIVALAAVVVARALVAWAHESIAHRAAAGVKAELRGRLVRRAADDAAIPGAGGPRRAEVSTLALTGLDALDGYYARYLPQLVLAGTVPVVVLLALAVTDLTATTIVVLTLPLIPVFMVLVGRATEAANASRWDALTRLSHHFLDVIEGMPTLRAFGRGRAQAERVRATTDRYRATTMATLRIAFLSSLVLELLATLSVALVAVSVGLRLVDGGLTLQAGLLAILLAPEAYLPLRQVGVHYHASAAGVAAADAVFAVLDAPSREAGHGVLPLPAGQRLEVRLHGVTAHHPGRTRPAPDRIDAVVRSGEVLGIAGHSGAGKSTVLAMLVGRRAPDEGHISVAVDDGAPIALSTVDRRSWQQAIAWVDQHPFLFEGTLAANVRLSRPDADDRAVHAALARAGLPLPLDRTVAAHGADLSAGERRRVALARALLREARLVILDEPTAGLDAATEHDVLSAVRAEAERGAAVVIVSHRPETLAIADHTVVLR